MRKLGRTSAAWFALAAGLAVITPAQAATGRNCVVDSLGDAQQRAILRVMVDGNDAADMVDGPVIMALEERMNACAERHGWSDDVRAINFQYTAILLATRSLALDTRLAPERVRALEAVGARWVDAVARSRTTHRTTRPGGIVRIASRLNITPQLLARVLATSGLELNALSQRERDFLGRHLAYRTQIVELAQMFDEVPNDSVVTRQPRSAADEDMAASEAPPARQSLK